MPEPTRIERLVAGSSPTFSAELVGFMCDPAFGSRSKREAELKVFELLYANSIEQVSVGTVANDLAITRSRARSLILETRARLYADESETLRSRRIVCTLVGWPNQKQVEVDGERLRILVDDPYARERLKNFAYERDIVIDGSFTSEIVSLTWASWSRLLEATLSKAEYNQVVATFAAAIKAEIDQDADAKQKLAGEKKASTGWWRESAKAVGRKAPSVLGSAVFRITEYLIKQHVGAIA